MKQDYFYSIGELSKITQLPIKTLRYYDQIELLKPEYIDPDTHFRYYSNNQLFIISIIKELKLFEFSLNQIKEFLKRENLKKIITLYKEKKNEIISQIDHLNKIKSRIENRFEHFESFFDIYENFQAKDNKYYIEVKNLKERTVVFQRKTTPFNLEEFSLRCIELHNLIEKYNLYINGPFMAIFHDDYINFDSHNADIETCGPIYTPEDSQFPFIRKIESGLYASIVAKGEHENSKEAYLKLREYLKENNYTISGPTIKIYILNAKLINSTQSFTSEIQIPVSK